MSKKEKLVVEHFVVIDVKQLDDLILENSKLKQQLTKKVKTIEVLRDLQKYNTTQLAEKQNVIDEINKEFVQTVHDWKTLCKKKDKEIESLKQQLEETNAGYDFTYEQSAEAIKELKQNQIQLAIQELEKTKAFIDDYTCENEPDFKFVRIKIDSQIKELKGEYLWQRD